MPGQGNPLGANIGADEKAAATVVSGALQAAQDGLGIDYNSDGRGIGFNPPSLLGIFAVPPYYHNGASENLMSVISDVKHRTANGKMPDRLSNPTDQISVFAFLETLDTRTVPVVPLQISKSGPNVVLAFDSIIGASYGIEARSPLTGVPSILQTVVGDGTRMQVQVPIIGTERYFRLVSP